MIRQLCLAAGMVMLVGASQAMAGVRGGKFEGTLIEVPDYAQYDATLNFAENGDAYFELFDGDPYPGNYTETDLLFLSFWSATYIGDDYETSGISLFSSTTFYYSVSPSSEYVYFGVLTRTGDAQFP